MVSARGHIFSQDAEAESRTIDIAVQNRFDKQLQAMKLNERARIMRALAIPSKAGTLIHHLRSDQKETMLAATEASVFAQPAGTQKICSLGRSYVIDYTGYRTMRICCMYMYVYTVLYSIVQYVSECLDQTRFSYQGMAIGHPASWDSSTKRYIRYNT